MKIGILICGHIPEELSDRYGDYDRSFAKLLGPDQFEYQSWAVVDNEFPENHDDVDGWLISGSKHGVYEDHSWIPPLEELIRDAYKNSIPIIGVCFGHQILAQALGGTVEKFSGGWSIGRVEYAIVGETSSASVYAYHQDQVITLPKDATCFGSTDFCQYAFLRYGKKAMSMQPHPEFETEFLEDLLRLRGNDLPEHIVKAAKDSVGPPMDSKEIGIQMRDFFLTNR